MGSHHPHASDLRIELLGHFQICARDSSIQSRHWRKQKPRQLLALLLCAPNGRLPRAEVCAALWPGHPDPGNNLHVAIHHLRKLCDELPAEPIDIELSQEQVAIHLPPDTWVDALEFRRRASLLLRGHADPAEYQAALSLYRGPLLPDDEGETWALPLREELSALHARLAVAAADALARLDAPEAEAPLRRLLAFDPTHEGAVQRLMLLAHRNGQRGLVQAGYDQLRADLAERLGLEPLPATERIFQACLRDGIATLPLGEWGLQDYRERRALPLPFAPVAQPPIGREREYAGLLELGAAARAGRGSIAALAGAGGMGKRRLAHAALTALHQQGWSVIAGAPLSRDAGAIGYEALVEGLSEYLRRSPPLELDSVAEAALVQLLGPAVPAALRPSSPPPRLESQTLLFLGLARLLEAIAAHGPLALLVSDVHRADADTLSFLLFLVRRIGTQRILLIATYRPDEVDPDHPLLPHWQEHMRQGLIRTFSLGRLSDESCLALLATLGQPVEPELARRLIGRSNGNPFFLLELARSALAAPGGAAPEDSLPAVIVDAIRGRLRQFSAAAQALLEAAAVAAPGFTPELGGKLQRMADSALEKALAELLHSRLLRETPQGLAFTQPLVRDVVYASLLGSRRARLHAAMADHLRQQPGAPESLVLHHLLRGGGRGATASAEHAAAIVAYGLQAAKAAMARLADEEARRCFESVLAALEPAGAAAADWIEALFGLASIHARRGEYAPAIELCLRAERWTGGLGGAEAERRVRLGWLRYRLSLLDDGLADFSAALELAPPGGAAADEALVGAAVIRYAQGRLRLARETLGAALPRLEAQPPSVAKARALSLAALIAFDESDGDAKLDELHRRAIASAEAAGDLLYGALLATNYANQLVRRGQVAAAVALLGPACDVSHQLGNRDFEAHQLAIFAWALLVAGDFPAALRRCEQAAALMRHNGNLEIQGDLLNIRAALARAQEQPALAERCARQCLDLISGQPFARTRGDALIELARLALLRGAPAEAETLARQAMAGAAAAEQTETLAAALLACAEALAGQGRAAEAAAAAYEGIAHARRQGAVLTLALGYLALARVALAGGNLALARSELERGKAIAVRCGLGLLYLEAVALGARLEARRQPSAAAREADDYNEDWIAPLLGGRQSIAERAHELGIPRAVLRRAYQRYHRRLEDLRAGDPVVP